MGFGIHGIVPPLINARHGFQWHVLCTWVDGHNQLGFDIFLVHTLQLPGDKYLLRIALCGRGLSYD